MTTPKERARQRKRRAAAKERGRKLIEAARARARKLIEAARVRGRKLVEAARARARKLTTMSASTAKRKVRSVKPTPESHPQGPTKLDSVVSRLQVREAIRQVTEREKPGSLLSVPQVRALARLPKANFDQAVLELMRAGEVSLLEHDFPASLAPSALAGLVQDEKGRAFNGIVLRQPDPGVTLMTKSNASDESVLLEKAKLYGAGKPVRIAKLRKDLSFSPARFDRAIGALHEAGKVAIYRDDNNVTAEKEGAYIVGGQPRHILYVR